MEAMSDVAADASVLNGRVALVALSGCHWSYPTSALLGPSRGTGRVRPVAPEIEVPGLTIHKGVESAKPNLQSLFQKPVAAGGGEQPGIAGGH